MNATIGVFLAEAGGPPTPSGGDVVQLMHYGGRALFLICLLGFVVAAAWLAWRQRRVEVPEKFTGWSCWEPCSAARPVRSSGR